MNGAERENHRRNATERAGRIDATELQPQLGDSMSRVRLSLDEFGTATEYALGPTYLPHVASMDSKVVAYRHIPQTVLALDGFLLPLDSISPANRLRRSPYKFKGVCWQE